MKAATLILATLLPTTNAIKLKTKTKQEANYDDFLNYYEKHYGSCDAAC